LETSCPFQNSGITISNILCLVAVEIVHNVAEIVVGASFLG